MNRSDPSSRLARALHRTVKIALMGASMQAAAADAPPAEVETPNLSVLGSYVSSDDVRGVDQGQGLQLAFGWSWTQKVQLQLQTSYVNFDTGLPSTDFYRSAISLDVLRYFNPQGVAPYVVVGAGAAYNDVENDALDGVDFTASAGVGLLSRPLTEYGVRLRAEARYVYDRFIGRPEDYHFSFGVTVPLRKPRTVEVVRTEIKEVVREVTREVVREAPSVARDMDGDGVPDDRDACPNTLRGATVDVRGCVPEKAVIRLTGVHFDHDSSRLTENSKSILMQAAESLRGQPGMSVEIAGHTDSRGSDAYNLGLSRRRAAAVAEFLTAAGIERTRLSAQGYGEAQPVDSNDTESGRERNRRVEFRVLAQ